LSYEIKDIKFSFCENFAILAVEKALETVLFNYLISFKNSFPINRLGDKIVKIVKQSH